MATLVCFHAHPDDEAIGTGGVMARASALGHRVVLVVATRGEQGKPRDGVLGPDEPLGRRRSAEVRRSAELLGAHRVEFLDYVDSGMAGEASNDNPDCFWQADIDEAAARLAAILAPEDVDVLTVYDANGVYGHPDHVQVYRVGVRAAELVGLPLSQVFGGTINRDRLDELFGPRDPNAEPGDGPPREQLGVREAEITHAVPVHDYLAQKRAALAAHESQIGPDNFFLEQPEDRFAAAFGLEWFVCLGRPRDAGEAMGSDLFAGITTAGITTPGVAP